MTANESSEVEGIDLDPRDVRALTEYMTVLADVGRARDAEDLYLVVSQSGSEYLVDARTGACECPDAQYRYSNIGCKHVRRVAFATSRRSIPAWVDRDAVDEQLGAHVDATPQVAATDGGVIDAGDDGEILTKKRSRPSDCQCWHADGDLPCWPCWRGGFEEPNPEAPAASE